MEGVCRTCLLKIPSNGTSYKLSDGKQNFHSYHIKTKLEFCIPEFNIGLLENPIICSTCVNDLNISYNFRKKCLDSEVLVREYCNSTIVKNGSINKFLTAANTIIHKHSKKPIEGKLDSKVTNANKEVLIIEDDVEFISEELSTGREHAQITRNLAVINTSSISVVPIANRTSDLRPPVARRTASRDSIILNRDTLNVINKIPTTTTISREICKTYKPEKNLEGTIFKRRSTNLSKSLGGANDSTYKDDTKSVSQGSASKPPKQQNDRQKRTKLDGARSHSLENAPMYNLITPNSTSRTTNNNSNRRTIINENITALPASNYWQTTENSFRRVTRSSSLGKRKGKMQINRHSAAKSPRSGNKKQAKTKSAISTLQKKNSSIPKKLQKNKKGVFNEPKTTMVTNNLEIPNENLYRVEYGANTNSISNNMVDDDSSLSAVKNQDSYERKHDILNDESLTACQTSMCDASAEILSKLPSIELIKLPVIVDVFSENSESSNLCIAPEIKGLPDEIELKKNIVEDT